MQTILDVKCKAFAVRIVHFYKFLTSTQKEAVLSKQILRSGTSIGANARERLNAQSNADFINKLSIGSKGSRRDTILVGNTTGKQHH